MNKFPELLPVVEELNRRLSTVTRRCTLPEGTTNEIHETPFEVRRANSYVQPFRCSSFSLNHPRRLSISSVLSEDSEAGSEYLGNVSGEAPVGAFLLSPSMCSLEYSTSPVGPPRKRRFRSNTSCTPVAHGSGRWTLNSCSNSNTESLRTSSVRGSIGRWSLRDCASNCSDEPT